MHEVCHLSYASRTGAVSRNITRGLTRLALFHPGLQPQTLEAAERIALPMICFASRRLAVLATPPNLGAECGIEPVFPRSRSGILPLLAVFFLLNLLHRFR